MLPASAVARVLIARNIKIPGSYLRAVLAVRLSAHSRLSPPLIPNECRNSVVRYERHTAQFSALPNPNEPPISELLALVIVASPKAKIRIAASFREPEEFRLGLRRSFRAFA